MNFKVGDIVYFKKQHTARYGKIGGSYTYYFNIGDRYLITDAFGLTNISTNDLVPHFISNPMRELLITKSEWREYQLSKIL